LDELSFQEKQALRASGVLRAFDRDPRGQQHFCANILTSATHHFLNATFAADKLSCTLNALDEDDPNSEEALAARAKVFKANMDLFASRRGHQVLIEYFALLRDLDGRQWQHWSGPMESRAHHAADMIVPMVESWRRLIFFVRAR